MHSTRPDSGSKKPRSYCTKLTSQIFSLTSVMPTFWPANTPLELILRRPMQIRPHCVTVMGNRPVWAHGY
jgi:hypothetical protein